MTNKKTQKIYDFTNFDKYNNYLKKELNKSIRSKRSSKVDRAFFILSMYLEEFLEMSDELVFDSFCESNNYIDLFRLNTEELLKVCNEVLDIEKIDELSNKDDHEIDKIRMSITRFEDVDVSVAHMLNSYIDIKDEIDYYLVRLKRLLKEKLDKRKSYFVKREYFIMAFHIYAILDNISSYIKEEIEKENKSYINSFNLIEDTYSKIYEKVRTNNNVKILRR